MAYSKEELMQEMLRREATRRGVDIGGGATPVPGNPQGPSAAEFTQGLSSSRPEGGEWHDEPRAALRGLTMGASDSVGSAIAAVPASFGSDKGIGEVYKDIRGTTQMQEDDYAAANPGLKQALEVGGTVAGAGGALAGSLAKLGGKALAGTKSGLAATRAARAGAKPRVTVRGGKVLEDAVKPVGKLRAGTVGAVKGATADAIWDDELDVGQGGKMGALGGILFNTPAGRAFLASQGGKIGGRTLSKVIYYGMHPSSRRKILSALKKFMTKGSK